MALERETNLYNAPTQQNHTDCTDEGKDKVGKIVHHPQRIAGWAAKPGTEKQQAHSTAAT